MQFSEKESTRFGLRIYRHVEDGPTNWEQIRPLIGADADIVIFRLPAEFYSDFVRSVEPSVKVSLGDQLAFYEMSPSAHRPIGDPESESIRLFKESDAKGVLSLAETEFKKVKNHYFSRPEFGVDAIAAGYREWCDSLLKNNSNLTFIYEIDGNVIGFIIGSPVESGFDIILNAVDGGFAGQGIYSLLLKKFAAHCFANSMNVYISTQTHNYAALKVIVKTGFKLKRVYSTLYIDRL